MTHPVLMLLPLLLLLACGPMSVVQAESYCVSRARDAASPRGDVAVGVMNGQVRSRVRLDISTDYLAGRDPSAVFEHCVFQKSGQPPSRALTARPDWTG